MLANLIMAVLIGACIWLFSNWAIEDAHNKAKYLRLTEKQIRKAGRNRRQRDPVKSGIVWVFVVCIAFWAFVIFLIKFCLM